MLIYNIKLFLVVVYNVPVSIYIAVSLLVTVGYRGNFCFMPVKG